MNMKNAWTKKQAGQHLNAARLLIKIKDLTFGHIRENPGVSEHDVQKFIIRKYAECKLISDSYPPIVAFDANSATPEFYPTKKSARIIKQGTFVLIDLWAKLDEKGAPFADITWVGYHGRRIPREIEKVFKTVIGSRDACLAYLKSQLSDGIVPRGSQAHKAAYDFLRKAGYERYIRHSTGHSLGTAKRDHGPKPDWLYAKNDFPLNRTVGYTIEPGLYLNGRFGVRSEIDFYISKDNRLVVTTGLQKRIVRL